MFPITELQDLIAEIRSKQLYLKRTAKDVHALLGFAIEQLPDDVPTPAPALGVKASNEAGESIAIDILPDLEQLEHIHIHTPDDRRLAALGVFDWKGFVSKLVQFAFQNLLPILAG
jgi:hypothetical protein